MNINIMSNSMIVGKILDFSEVISYLTQISEPSSPITVIGNSL